MAEKVNVIFFAFVLLGMVCITTQKTWRQARCDKVVKRMNKRSCEYECLSTKTPVDGVWEEWTETSACSVTCGGGKKPYSRNCIQPKNGGKACEGDASKTDNCGDQECPGTLKQCDTVPVERDLKTPWNPDSEIITVTTDSVAGSEEWMRIWFFDKDGIYAGDVQITFYSLIEYSIGWCMFSKPLLFTLPTPTQKTWTLTYNYTERRLVLKRNGVTVVNDVVTVSVCTRWSDNPQYKATWDRKPTQIKFDYDGTASDSYCISSNTGAI